MSQVLSGRSYDFGVLSRGINDCCRITGLNCCGTDQFTADPEGCCASEDEVSGSIKVYPPGRNHANVGKRPTQSFEIAWSAHQPAREYLHEVRSRFPGVHDLR